MWHSADPSTTAAFYTQFGIAFVEERLGSGPIHYAFQDGSLTVELYPTTKSTAPGGVGTVIGFEVDDIEQANSIVEVNDIEITEKLKTTAMGRRVIVRDPDGRHVFLFSPA